MGAVASPHHLATAAGARILREGGNAIDAALAVNVTLAAVAPYTCGPGGDLFAMVWDGRRLHAYNGSGRAPAAASIDAVASQTGAGMPAFGPHTVTVPGAVDAWFALLDRFGTRSFDEVARDAVAYARDGFRVGDRAAPVFAASERLYANEPEWLRIYGGTSADTMLEQPDLAGTLATLATKGADAFYRGEIGDAIVDAVRARGGLLAFDDLDAHHGDWVEPLGARFRDLTVFEMPPNTQGIAALEALRIADGWVLDGAARDHVLIEAMKLALSDRNRHVSDPAWMSVDPQTLIDDNYIAGQRERIDIDRAGSPHPGRRARGGTAYMCVADDSGMLVSLIQSNYLGFGSGIVTPGWGINLHCRGASFTLDRFHVNHLAPRKRPMHTLVPAMAFRGKDPWLAFGTMGADAQAQVHVQLLTRMIDDGLPPQDALDAPRWSVDPDDWTVRIEAAHPHIDALRARGHRVIAQQATGYDATFGHAHAIRIDADGYTAGADPRSEGAAVVLRTG